MTDKKTLEDNNILVVENTKPQINLQAPLLDRIDNLIELSEDSFLADSFFETHHDLIQSVADDLSLTPMQTVLLMPFIASPDETLTNHSLRKYFLCSATRLFRVSADLTTLVHRRYVFHGGNFDCEGFRLTKKAAAAFSEGHGLPEINWAGLSPYGFLNTFKKTHSDFTVRGELLNKEFYAEMNELIRQNDQLELVKALNELSLDEEHTAVLLFACRCLICDKRVEIYMDEISDFFGEYEDIEYGLNTRHDVLVKKKLFESAGDNQLRRNVFKLTKHAKETLLKEYHIAEKKDEIVESGLFEVIRAKDIKRKKMFYSERNEKDLEVLAGLLTEDKLQKVRQDFCKKGYRQGFNCLFYGAPGTGKTETALQLALHTGRDIMQVEISCVRDKWYGETEKIVKDIFVQYARLVKNSKRTPILLFNEADAILSVRSGVSNSHSTDKTENAIQNILLQEMENHEGILIATTNLADNLDKAFERRFIYKINFEQPSLEAKVAIWKSHLIELNDSRAKKLAETYGFSGGQIENVARKVFVERVLFSKPVAFNRIVELCEEEKLDKKTGRKAIGFNKR